MRRIVIGLVVFIAGLAAGVSTHVLVRARPQVGLAEQVAIMSVLPPDLDGAKVQGDTNFDAVWQRTITDTVFSLKLPNSLYSPLHEPDVERTAWYGSFEDDEARLRALVAHLHVEQVPGCSFILVWFDAGSAEDAKTIANAVVRSHQSIALSQARRALADKAQSLRDTLNDLVRLEDDIRSEIDRANDEVKLDRLQTKLEDATERRRQMQNDYEKAMARMFEPDLGRVQWVKMARVPRED